MSNGQRFPTVEDYQNAPPHPLRQTGGRRAAARQNSMPDRPLVSIITVVLNGAATIDQTIQAVRAQTYPNIEYVVIDAVSTDGTVEILRASEDIIDYWISEPDSGHADASSKGIAYSTGDFIFILPSDDWITPDFIGNAVQSLQRSNADFVFGDVIWYRGDTAEFHYASDPNYAKNPTWRLPLVPFSASVIRRKRFEELGLFNLDYELASDTEWIARLHARGGHGVYNDKMILNFRLGGKSNVNFYESARYVRRALVENGFSRTGATLVLLYGSSRYWFRSILHRLLPDSTFKQLMRFIRRSYSKPLQPPMSD